MPRKRSQPLVARGGQAESDPPRVLVVEDDPDLREWLRLSLGLRGWIVEEVANGEDAVERVKTDRPDVVLLDQHLPGMTGATCAEALRALSSELRIILASAHMDRELSRRARDLHLLPIDKLEHERLFELFDLLAAQLGRRAASV